MMSITSPQKFGLSALVSMLVLASLVTAQFTTLNQYPPPSCDETAYGDAAFTLLTAGRPAWSVFPEPDRFGREINVVHMGRTYLMGLGTMLVLFGRTLYVARLYSLIGGLLAVGLTFLLGQRLYNRRVGALAALVFLTSFKFFLTSHLGRPETWVTACILGSLYLLLRTLDRHPPAWQLLAAGFLCALTLDIHFNALSFLAATGVLVLWRFGWQQRRWRAIAAFSAGVGVGLVLWVALHAWPSLVVAWQQLTGFSVGYTGLGGNNPLLSLIENPLSLLPYLKTAYWDTPWPVSLIETGLAGLGLGLALIRRGSSDKIWLIVVGVSLTAFAIAFSQRFVNYSVLWTPFLLLGGFAALDSLAGRLGAGAQVTAGLLVDRLISLLM